jgi:hypothetical protein
VSKNDYVSTPFIFRVNKIRATLSACHFNRVQLVAQAGDQNFGAAARYVFAPDGPAKSAVFARDSLGGPPAAKSVAGVPGFVKMSAEDRAQQAVCGFAPL